MWIILVECNWKYKHCITYVVPNVVMLLYLMYEDTNTFRYTVLLRHYVNTEHYVNGNWLEIQLFTVFMTLCQTQ
jgi:hypothetical protein